MDLLLTAYADGEGEDEETLPIPSTSTPSFYSNKRNRSEEEPYNQRKKPSPAIRQAHGFSSCGPVEPPAAAGGGGRYVSKRERAMLAAAAASSEAPNPVPSPPPTVITSPVFGSISDSDLPCEILASLRCPAKEHGSRINGKQTIVLNGHINAVNSIQWCHSHAHLLASAGMDQTVHVWNVWNRTQKKSRVFKYHNAAIKDVRWSPLGLFLLSCGYDSSSRLVDVEKGIETQVFKEDQVVETIRFHPTNSNIFLSGGSKGYLRLWDIRANKMVHEYCRGLGGILDIEFTADGDRFITSTDISRSRISENSIIVWDVARQVPLSNQVYVEAYTCPCIRYHPSDACFVAQSNGNYIAIFSARPPFKLDKYKRYGQHGVWGFSIKCNFSLDGKQLASGSSDGCIYLYNYRSSELVQKIKTFEQPCIDVAYHPVMPNVIAACSWKGEVCVFL